jgi:Protein of unknown function (DUF1592)/Protein of unknown function (DUF1588)/Protein of unknown function (DUF1585)/Protein of unknown function (DUF1587)/Protein of unknown function (DUF1595)
MSVFIRLMTRSGHLRHFPSRVLAVAAVLIPIHLPLARAGPANGERQALLDRYCVTCHNSKSGSGGLSLQGASPDQPAIHADIWEKVVRKLQAREMPPAGMPQPAQEISSALVTSLVRDLDAAARAHTYAGQMVVRRLNRFQYANATRDLLHIELPISDELPPDGIAAGFDDIGDALSMSPLLLEQYLKVSRRVSQFATGVGDASPVTENYPAPEAQSGWLGSGLPFGTRGGIRVQHYFPFDGEYSLRAFIGRDSLPHPEGIRFFQTRVEVTAGAHTVVVTFPDEFAQREGPVPNVAGKGGAALGGPLDTRGSAIHPTIEFRLDSHRLALFEIGGISVGEAAFAGQPGPPTLDRIEISGPYNATGVTETPSRRRIFVCRPAAGQGDGLACASKILTTILRRAFRRDVSAADVRPFLKTWQVEREKHDFDFAIAAALRDVLVSPDFLFRLEFDPSAAQPGSVQPVSGWELASRLSFFIWGSIPDDELLDVAAAGKLTDAAILTRETRRMLADPRAVGIVDDFTEQWLGLRGLGSIKPDPTAYPSFESALSDDFRQETRLFLRSVFRENRSVLDLIGANYTYLNQRLAHLYGIPGVEGPGFRRVTLDAQPERGGLLSQGSILLLTSHTTRTSPILRGKWILDNLLNSPPPPPPPGIPPLDESATNGKKLTTRQQIERHRSNAACASCHARMDPFGFALESFDVIGRSRTHDQGGEIDPSGQLPNGDSFSGPQGLRQYLLSHPDRFVNGVASRLLTYALGRELDVRDQPTVREIIREVRPGGYRTQDLIVAIVNSAPFRMRQTPDAQKSEQSAPVPHGPSTHEPSTHERAVPVVAQTRRNWRNEE